MNCKETIIKQSGFSRWKWSKENPMGIPITKHTLIIVPTFVAACTHAKYRACEKGMLNGYNNTSNRLSPNSGPPVEKT